MFDYKYSDKLVRHENNNLSSISSMYRSLISTYCGHKTNLSLYSSSYLFEIKFETFESLGNQEYSEDEDRILFRKGFKAYYKFDKTYVSLDFITGKHVKGSCKFLLNYIIALILNIYIFF